MEIVQEIGAYAGFAAVVGLAVMSALYFSQARDVRRLREWAGRAPERAAEGQPIAPAPRTVTARPTVRPTAGEAAAQARAAAAAPPKPGQAPATGPPPVPGAPAATPAGAQAATTKPDEDAATKGAPAEANGDAPKPPPRTVPARRTVPAPGVPLRSAPQTSIMQGAGAPPRKKENWFRRVHWPAPRYLAIMVVGIVVLGFGAAYGIQQLLQEETPSGPAKNVVGEESPREKEVARSENARVTPGKVTVAVLNGTTVPGLAAQVADKLETAGFKRGNVTNSTDQQKAESVVQYSTSNGVQGRAEATAVSKKLGISQVSEADGESQQLAGPASVIVVVGQDQTQ